MNMLKANRNTVRRLIAILCVTWLSGWPTATGATQPATRGAYDTWLPAVPSLVASTYFGGSELDSRHTVMARDSRGCVFIADWTRSPDLPVGQSSYDASLGGVYDVFIAKFSADLDSLLACTYLGGSEVEGDWPMIDLEVGPNDDVYIAGKTSSADFPTTAGCFQSFPAGIADVFLSRLSNDLSTLVASTYLGGRAEDRGISLVVLPDGSVVLTGCTASDNFPYTSGCFDSTYSGDYDVFVARFDASLTTLLASTLLGGTAFDQPEEIQLGPDDDVFIVGSSSSAGYPTTPGAFQTAKIGLYNGFVTRMPLDLTGVTTSTFFGGNQGWDFIYGLDFDGTSVYVTGHTGSSSGFPVTSGAYDTSYNSGAGPNDGDDVFVSRLSSDLTTVLASTYIGGQGWDGGWKVLVLDSLVLVCGSVGAGSFPFTSGAWDTTFNGGSYKYSRDAFFAALDKNLARLVHSTFLGGPMNEHAHDLAVLANGDIYVAGGTGSDNFPVTAQAYDTTYNGGDGENGGDAFMLILPHQYLLDSDSDGINDQIDNCPLVMNASQADWDSDHIGDACDSCNDTDADGYGTPGFPANTCQLDNCVDRYNPGQEDNDQDGIGNACCCTGVRANVNYTGIVDLADLSALVSYLTGGGFVLPCPNEANVNGVGIVDLADLSALVSYLTGGGYVLPNCP